MNIPENTRPPASTTKPSLVGQPALADASGPTTTSPMRMLDGIERTPRGRARPGSRAAVRRWPLLLAGALVVLALAAWWSQRSDREAPADAGAPGPARMPMAVAPVERKAAAEPAGPPTPGTTSSPQAAEAARIEASVEAQRAAPVKPPAPAVAATPATPARVAARAEARPAIATQATAARAPRAPAPAATTATATRSTDDADVALVRAMLARLSTGTAGSADAPFVNATIGQLAAKCQANAPDDAIAAFECRRQVCADYWGRVEACPVALAPKNR